VHQVGLITRIYRDVRSTKHKISKNSFQLGTYLANWWMTASFCHWAEFHLRPLPQHRHWYKTQQSAGERRTSSGLSWPCCKVGTLCIILLTNIRSVTFVYNSYILLLLFSLALQLSAGYGLLVSRGFLITRNNAPESVGFLWTSDQLVAETSTWQHTTEKHQFICWDSIPRSNQASGRRPTR
jgi:hypothetical protein